MTGSTGTGEGERGQKKSQGLGSDGDLAGLETRRWNGRRGPEVLDQEKGPKDRARRAKLGKRTSRMCKTKVGGPEEQGRQEKGDGWRRTG